MSKRPLTKQQRSAERLKRKARYGKRWEEVRHKVYMRDGNRCRACGRTFPQIKSLHCHHIVLLRVSKSNDIRNLISLCPECHRTIENKAISMLKAGRHREDVYRWTHRYLIEQRAKRLQTLISPKIDNLEKLDEFSDSD